MVPPKETPVISPGAGEAPVGGNNGHVPFSLEPFETITTMTLASAVAVVVMILCYVAVVPTVASRPATVRRTQMHLFRRIRCSAVHCGTVGYGTVRHGMVLMKKYGMELYCAVQRFSGYVTVR